MGRLLKIVGGMTLLCICSAMLLLVGGMAGQQGDSTNTSAVNATQEKTQEETQEESQEEGPAAYQVGDVISIDDIALVILGWNSPKGDDFNKPKEGNKFLAVEVLIVNQGDAPTSISSLLQMKLKDETGQNYNVDLLASTAAGSSAPDGELSAGERLRGMVGFQLPQDVTGLTFVFDPSVFGTGKVFVKLGAKPVSLDPPTDLAGEQEQLAYVVGDIIEVGDLTIRVNEVTYPTGDDFNKPEAGNQFVVVDVTFENKGTEANAISSLLQMTLKDATGQKYDLDLLASTASGGSTPDGEIAPGEKLRGQAGYQVPNDVQGLVFVFDADIFGHGKLRVAIQ
ncbi:MAG: DUF4352 domain-containing protein [Ardenticatenaceae bacterium]